MKLSKNDAQDNHGTLRAALPVRPVVASADTDVGRPSRRGRIVRSLRPGPQTVHENPGFEALKLAQEESPTDITIEELENLKEVLAQPPRYAHIVVLTDDEYDPMSEVALESQDDIEAYMKEWEEGLWSAYGVVVRDNSGEWLSSIWGVVVPAENVVHHWTNDPYLRLMVFEVALEAFPEDEEVQAFAPIFERAFNGKHQEFPDEPEINENLGFEAMKRVQEILMLERAAELKVDAARYMSYEEKKRVWDEGRFGDVPTNRNTNIVHSTVEDCPDAPPIGPDTPVKHIKPMPGCFFRSVLRSDFKPSNDISGCYYYIDTYPKEMLKTVAAHYGTVDYGHWMREFENPNSEYHYTCAYTTVDGHLRVRLGRDLSDGYLALDSYMYRNIVFEDAMEYVRSQYKDWDAPNEGFGFEAMKTVRGFQQAPMGAGQDEPQGDLDEPDIHEGFGFEASLSALDITLVPPIDDPEWVPLQLPHLQPGELLRVRRGLTGPILWVFPVGDEEGGYKVLTAHSYNGIYGAIKALAAMQTTPEDADFADCYAYRGDLRYV